MALCAMIYSISHRKFCQLGIFALPKRRKSTRSEKYEYLGSFCTTAGLFCKKSLQVYNQSNMSPSLIYQYYIWNDSLSISVKQDIAVFPCIPVLARVCHMLWDNIKTKKMYDKYIQRRYKRSSKISVLLCPVVKILSSYHRSRCPSVFLLLWWTPSTWGRKGLFIWLTCSNHSLSLRGVMPEISKNHGGSLLLASLDIFPS